MKIFKALLVTIVLGSLVLAAYGCGSPKATGTADSQIATAKRGNLTVDITAAGNLALSRTEDLPINLFYPTGTKGTIGSVLVEEGDTVTEGQLLVTLDTSEWNDQLKLVKDALDTALRNVVSKNGTVTDDERNVAALQRQVTVAEEGVTKAERNIEAKQLAVTLAELNLQSANSTLFQITEVQKAQDNVDEAEMTLTAIKQIIQGAISGGGVVADATYWRTREQQAEQDLADAQDDLENILSDNNISLTADVKLLVAQKKYQVDQSAFALGGAELDLEDAKAGVDDAQTAVDDAKYAVTKAQQALDNARIDLSDAQTSVDDAQNNYNEALSMSPEIRAPFDGFITQVNVSGGDEVLNGTIAVQIADPNKFEADILVSEMDITQVKLDGDATVTADAMPSIAYPAKVTHIAPTATIQSGVVNYDVKVEVEPTPATSQNQTTPSSANTTASELPPMLQRAVDSGRMTREQAEQFAASGPPAGFTPSGNFTAPGGFTLPQGTQFPNASSSQTQSQVPSAASQDFQLREGLTVTVNIIVASRTNVVLVPNGAVTTQGGKSYVEVVTSSGGTEKREVTTGISDWQYTEITSGLNEGEQVEITQSTSSASSSTANNRGGMGFFAPPR
jgi:multidrug efflux pump subunit AcrA (membrane-fusion protein)